MNKLLLVFGIGVMFAMILQVALNHKIITEIHSNRDHIATLGEIVEKQSLILDNIRTRMTKLERPDEPVYPPRNPGRLGTIDSRAVGSIDE